MKNNSKHFVIGNGSHSSEIQELISANSIETVECLDSSKERSILESEDFVNSFFYLGIGDAIIRRKVLERWKLHIEKFPPLKHNFCQIASSSIIENATVIQFGCVVSTFALLKSGVLLNWNSSVGHHTTVGEGVVINPGASIAGHCEIGPGVLIGSGARILSGIQIGENAIIGAGAVVTKDVPPNKTYIGIPAKELL